jgi:hypothetical protein
MHRNLQEREDVPIGFSRAATPITHSDAVVMFKRVEKRRRKKEEEEALGLDEDMKEIMGIQDTDSEESESDSDDDGVGDGLDGEEDVEGVEEDVEDESEDDSDELHPPISVKEALRDPVYVVAVDPPAHGCIACPGKIFKSSDTLEQHKTSHACMLCFPTASNSTEEL